MHPDAIQQWQPERNCDDAEASASLIDSASERSPTDSYCLHECKPKRKMPPMLYRASARDLLLHPRLNFDRTPRELPSFIEQLVRGPKVCWNHVQGRCSEAEMCTRLHIVDQHCVLCGANGFVHPLQLTHHLMFCPEMVQLRREYRRIAEEVCGICFSPLPLNFPAPEVRHLAATVAKRPCGCLPDTVTSPGRRRIVAGDGDPAANESNLSPLDPARTYPGPLGLLADCGHTFCYTCIEMWRIAMHNSISAECDSVKCPVCRTLNSTIVPCTRFIGDRARCSREKARFVDRFSQGRLLDQFHHGSVGSPLDGRHP